MDAHDRPVVVTARGAAAASTRVALRQLGAVSQCPKTDVEVGSNVRIRIGNYLIKPSYLDDGLDEIQFQDHLNNKAANGLDESELSEFEPIEKITNGLSEMDFDAASDSNGAEIDTRATQVFKLGDLEKYSFRKNGSSPESDHPKEAEVVVAAAEIEEFEVELPAAAVNKAAAAFDNHEVVEIEMERAVEHSYQSAPEFEAIITGRTDIIDIQDLNFDAVALHRLSGQVLHRGKPLAGVSVVAEGIGQTTTDNDGTFSFSNIEDGTSYTLTVSKDRFRFASARSSGVLSKDTNLSLEAIKLVVIRGRIVHKGSPLAGVVVDGGPLGTTITAEDGSYQFNDIPENTEYTIRASKPGFKLR